MAKKIVGVFKTEDSAINAIRKLEYDGYIHEEISVIAKQRDQLDLIEEVTDVETENKNVPNAKTGAAAGGAIGGLGALFLELTTLAIPGVGPFIAAGPIVATVSGLVAGGAVGGVTGALIDMGFTLNEAKDYKKYLDEGDIVVIVEEKDNSDLVYKIFEDNGSVTSDQYKLDAHEKNEAYIDSKWHAFQGDPQKRWTMLTPDDMKFIKDDTNKLSSKLQEKYGWTKEQADEEVKNYRK